MGANFVDHLATAIDEISEAEQEPLARVPSRTVRRTPEAEEARLCRSPGPRLRLGRFPKGGPMP